MPAPHLAGFWLLLIAMPNPVRGLTWITNNSRVPQYLRGLADGSIPLTHQALHELASWRTAAHLRDLLMAVGALPRLDRQILLFERWYQHRLAAITDPEQARLLRRFAGWHLLPKLHTQASRRPLGPASRNVAASRLTTAATFLTFLTWLAARQHRLDQAGQADIDRWYAGQPDPDRARAFLRWAMADGHMPLLRLPTRASRPLVPISQHRRLALLRRCLTDTTIPLRTRVAACLVLLYAQPVSRLLRLTLDDITDSDGQTFLRLGTPPTPVPEPFATMLTALGTARANMNTATNADARWLFPGGRVGQPLTSNALLPQLRALGIQATQTRTAAFRQLVLQAPAPVVADALGFRPSTATKHVTVAGGTWNRYPLTRPPR
ncbi:site-specific integrase [Nonomuraea sp. NEAU-A123]|uniref:site-specific integrase n=1 Tax=Nonomuraea sp. NEAU-A123 TaxID=2839649 RepID=UPI001BE4B0E8|nr:site-specific integrase [Nonomuraea sp. NEAU-A123]MBT2235780.1 hypothetical protein [Nonomuraea sp. NEAU-A123]